jgi:hypothetical protein
LQGRATSSAQLRWPLVDVRPLKRYCSSSRSWLPLAGSAPLPLLPPRADHCCARRAARGHSVQAQHGHHNLAGLTQAIAVADTARECFAHTLDTAPGAAA